MGVRSKMLGITANYSEEEKQEFLEAGGDVYFEKPLSPYKFIPILEDIDRNMWRKSSQTNKGDSSDQSFSYYKLVTSKIESLLQADVSFLV